MARPDLTDSDWRIRLFVYTFFIEHSRPPSVTDTANHFQRDVADVRVAYQRLHQAHMFFLEPGTDSIRIANPLSAVPTLYQVFVGDKVYQATCAWDSLGIPAMLAKDATIVATLPASHNTVTYSVRGDTLEAAPAFVHFPLPFKQWYDDLIDT